RRSHQLVRTRGGTAGTILGARDAEAVRSRREAPHARRSRGSRRDVPAQRRRQDPPWAAGVPGVARLDLLDRRFVAVRVRQHLPRARDRAGVPATRARPLEGNPAAHFERRARLSLPVPTRERPTFFNLAAWARPARRELNLPAPARALPPRLAARVRMR